MTMPRERHSAVNNTRQFLMDLQDPKKTPRIPHAIRREAHRCLQHFPTEYDMSEASESLERQNNRQREWVNKDTGWVWKEHN